MEPRFQLARFGGGGAVWKRALSSLSATGAQPRPQCRVHASLKYPQGWGLPEQLD